VKHLIHDGIVPPPIAGPAGALRRLTPDRPFIPTCSFPDTALL